MSAIHVEASLSRASIAPRERAPLQVRIENRGQELSSVPHPRQSSALHLILLGPEGEQVVTPGAVVAPGGVPQVSNLAVPSGRRHLEEFELRDYFELRIPGDYKLTVEYEWGEGERWQSPALPLCVLPPAALFAATAPLDGAITGGADLVWVEAESGKGRLLASQMWSGREFLAREAVALPAEARPRFSVTEPGKNSFERWVAWIHGGRAWLAFFGQGLYPDLPARELPGGAARDLASPLLALDAADARPRATLGVVGEKALHLLEIAPDGTSRAAHTVALPATPAAVVCAHATQTRLFALVFAEGGEVRVDGFRVPWGAAPGPLERWLPPVHGAFLAADLRSAPLDGAATFAGLLLARKEGWARLTFTVPPAGKVAEASFAAAKVDGSQLLRARIDSKGRLRALLASDGRPAYLAAGAAAPAPFTGVFARVRSGDLLLPATGGAMAFLYDDERGPLLLDVP
jgi:hypothetical protein